MGSASPAHHLVSFSFRAARGVRAHSYELPSRVGATCVYYTYRRLLQWGSFCYHTHHPGLISEVVSTAYFGAASRSSRPKPILSVNSLRSSLRTAGFASSYAYGHFNVDIEERGHAMYNKYKY